VNSSLVSERVALEKRNGLLGTVSLDSDLFEERSRILLNRGNRNDVVVMTAN